MEMRKAVITILGTILPPREGQEKANYYFSDELKEKFALKKESYTNMLPLLVDNFSAYGDIKSVYTNLSKTRQIEVLKYEKIIYEIEEKGLFVSENIKDEEAKYSYFLSKYNDLIEEYDKVIIDVSHGFRHFPILAIINLIIQNIKSPEKIEHILFAKEIVKGEKGVTGRYEIIDLKEYLDLAKLSFVLSSFASNYTVGNKMNFTNYHYKELVEKLKIISTHILGNSLKQLIGKDSLTDKTIQNIKSLIKRDTKLSTFKTYTDEIIKHLEKIKNLDKENKYTQLYKLSYMMNERGYLLNSITLLNEAIGFYCVEELKKIDSSIEEHITTYNEKISFAETKDDKKKFNLYKLSHHSKNIIKQEKEFKGAYLFNESENEKSNVKSTILNYLKSKDYKQLSKLIEDIEDLRNNLAHGNSSEEIENVKDKISSLLKEYKAIAKILDDINVEERFRQIEKEKGIPKKTKPKGTGITAPEEKVNNFKDLFNNR